MPTNVSLLGMLMPHAWGPHKPGVQVCGHLSWVLLETMLLGRSHVRVCLWPHLLSYITLDHIGSALPTVTDVIVVYIRVAGS